MGCRLLPGAVSHHYRNDSGRSPRTGSGIEQINYAGVLVSSGSIHSLWPMSLRVHSWVYWINVLGSKRGSRKVFFPSKDKYLGNNILGHFILPYNGEIFWVFSYRKNLFSSWLVTVCLILGKGANWSITV